MSRQRDVGEFFIQRDRPPAGGELIRSASGPRPQVYFWTSQRTCCNSLIRWCSRNDPSYDLLSRPDRQVRTAPAILSLGSDLAVPCARAPVMTTVPVRRGAAPHPCGGNGSSCGEHLVARRQMAPALPHVRVGRTPEPRPTRGAARTRREPTGHAARPDAAQAIADTIAARLPHA
jgi:hypothetical protein